MKTLLILNDPPIGTDRSCNRLRLTDRGNPKMRIIILWGTFGGLTVAYELCKRLSVSEYPPRAGARNRWLLSSGYAYRRYPTASS